MTKLPIEQVLPDLTIDADFEGEPVFAFMLLKCMDPGASDQNTVAHDWSFRTTSPPNRDELLGALRIQVRILEDELASEWDVGPTTAVAFDESPEGTDIAVPQPVVKRKLLSDALPGMTIDADFNGTPVFAFVLIKCRDSDASNDVNPDFDWSFRTTTKPNREELLGALTIQVRILEDELAAEWALG